MGVDISGFADTALDAAQLASEAWSSTVLTDQADGVRLSNTRCKFGPNSTGPFADYSTSIDGGLSVNQVTPQVAMIATKVTATGGRSGRGRMFIPGLTEPDVNSAGIIGSAYLAAMQAKLTALGAALVDASLVPVLLHADSVGDTTPHPLIGIQLQSKVATQRRRLRG